MNTRFATILLVAATALVPVAAFAQGTTAAPAAPTATSAAKTTTAKSTHQRHHSQRAMKKPAATKVAPADPAKT